MVAPPWIGGSAVLRYGVPVLKGAVLCALAYVAGCFPAIIQTLRFTGGSVPVGALLMGMAVPAAMFALGYALGAIMGSRWSLVPATLLPAALCWGSVFLLMPRTPKGDVFPRAWGSPLAAAMPVMDTGIGAEPGLSINPSAVTVRWVLVAVVLTASTAACILTAHWWRPGLSWIVAPLAVLLLVPTAAGGLVAMSGPAEWRRSAPFTPVCKSIDGVPLSVCAHPDDGAQLRRYIRYMHSVASWFPKDSVEGSSGLVLLLGNAFTPTSHGQAWNLTDRGLTELQHLGGKKIQVMTDTVTERTGQYSDLADITETIVKEFIHADCSAMALKNVYKQRTLDDGASVSAFVLEQLPQRMRETAYEALGGGNGSSGMGSARGPAADLLNDATNEEFHAYVRRNLSEIERCAVTPSDVIDDLGKNH
ncbi:MAG: hypothetical protein M3Z40_06265 [Bifidobacterium sp.]|nr:hypothetical protein [Bifidobacterium sp.]